jgi:hypothetical protein
MQLRSNANLPPLNPATCARWTLIAKPSTPDGDSEPVQPDIDQIQTDLFRAKLKSADPNQIAAAKKRITETDQHPDETPSANDGNNTGARQTGSFKPNNPPT